MNVEDVAAVVANMFGQAAALDEESARQMQLLMKLVAEKIETNNTTNVGQKETPANG